MFWLAVKGDGFGAAFSHAFSGELEAVGVVDEAIENGVGDRGVPNGSMPGVHGELTCDDGGPVGRSKSPGYGHLKLPHLMIAVSAAEQQ
ncbi:hypothetical protein ACVIU7_007966 [Bradyrhizobium liaoningense]